MISVDRLFGNIFDTPLTTPDRLLLHAKDHLARLVKGNTNHAFDVQIALLTPLIATLETDVSDEDSTLNLQTGQTDEVNLVTINFRHTLSTLNGVIANSVGGKASVAYKEFFPRGLTEYDQANRKTMPVLTTRINKAATKYATMLGATVTATLQGFQATYTAARSVQNTSITDLSTDRGDKAGSVTGVELGLVQSVHTVGNAFPANVVKCSGFFNFNLLYTVAHRKHTFYNKVLAESEVSVVVNRSFTDSVTITLRNKSTSADIVAWIGLTAIDPPNAQAITIKAGKASVSLPSSLGDSAGTFLIIKDASLVNPATYQVEIIG